MATFTLLPNATGTASLHWVSSAGDRHECLDDDNGDTSFVSCDNSVAFMIIEYANPSVAEADIDTITSVRFISSGRSTNRTTDAAINIKFEAPTAGFGEVCFFDRHASSYETINGTARTTSDGSSAWTYSDLEALEMRCTKFLPTAVRLSYLALEVTYTEVVSADNATFFGVNF